MSSGSTGQARPLAVRGAALALVCLALAVWQLQSAALPTGMPTWLRAYPSGDASMFFDPSAVVPKKVGLLSETRNAVLPARYRTLRRMLTPAEGTALEIPMALLCPPAIACHGSFDFTVRAGDRVLAARVLRAETDAGRWQLERLDLSAWAGQLITLEFDIGVIAKDAGARPHRAVAVWGEPLLIQPRTAPQLNLLLISIDTLRADHLGSYGYTRNTSPHLDALAAEGVRFARAISQAPWTTPAHMSLLTSLYPSAHRVNQGWSDFEAFRAGTGRYRTLSHDTVTLAEILRDNAYRTVALTGRGTMAGALGFNQGFDIYRERRGKLTAARLSDLDGWLEQLGGAPFFIFFHTFEVHAPYRHLDFTEGMLNSAERKELEHLIAKKDWPALLHGLPAHLQARGLFRRELTAALYDGGIRYTDAFLGRLFSALRQRGLYDRTLVVVTSDHGEEFGEHDPSRIYNAHCTTLYDELIRVPLIMRVPQRFQPGTVVAEQVQLIDVVPTILELLGLHPDPAMQGRSLVSVMAGESAPAEPLGLSEATCSGPEWKTLRTSTLKYIMALDVNDGERTGLSGPVVREELFELRADPEERASVLERQPELGRQMRELLSQILRPTTQRRPAGASSVEITSELRERLRALGYVE